MTEAMVCSAIKQRLEISPTTVASTQHLKRGCVFQNVFIVIINKIIFVYFHPIQLFLRWKRFYPGDDEE